MLDSTTTPRADATTRERILRAASSLFASRGYYGTTTREIAALVDIRQPSLFHHFASKAAIAETLLDHSLARVVGPMRELAAQGGPAAPRLYGYLYFDTQFLATSPYNLAGLYTDDLLQSREFSVWRELHDDLHASIADIIRQGTAREEFVAVEPVFAQELISSLTIFTIGNRYGQSRAEAAQFADDVASFALRGILAAVSQLPQVRAAGAKVADAMIARISD